MTTIVLPGFAQNIDPQYIFVRKDPMNCNPVDCSLLWNMDDPNRINMTAINDIFDKVGTKGNVSNTRKIGIGAQFNYYLMDFGRLEQSLINLLNLSKTYEVPIYLNFNGVLWWDNRPDLWNWMEVGISADEKLKRQNNVEWFCDSPTCAVPGGLRNWGSVITVKPQANLASRVVIDDIKKQLNILLPHVVNYYKSLPPDKKWLLGGIDFGTETDIGLNNYGYGTVGYAAVRSLGLVGGPTTENIVEIIRRFLNEQDKLAFDLGIPRNKIFNHVSPQYSHAGVTTFGNPSTTLFENKLLEVADNGISLVSPNIWASSEWYVNLDSTQRPYINLNDQLRNTLSYRNNKFFVIANWEGIRGNSAILTAIKTVINESPGCWVTAPTISKTVSGNSATISWVKGTGNDQLAINISDTLGFNVNGMLSTPNLLLEENSTRSSFTINNLVANKKYYVAVAANGCNNSQRKIAYEEISLGGSTTVSPTNYEGKAVKTASDPTVYMIESGKRRRFPDWDTFLSKGFKDGDQIILTDAIINTFPMGADIPSVNIKPGDFDGDKNVDLEDFGMWKSKYLLIPRAMTLTEFGIWKNAYLNI